MEEKEARDRKPQVECPELPGCASQGDTVEEALEMIKDAIAGHLPGPGTRPEDPEEAPCLLSGLHNHQIYRLYS